MLRRHLLLFSLVLVFAISSFSQNKTELGVQFSANRDYIKILDSGWAMKNLISNASTYAFNVRHFWNSRFSIESGVQMRYRRNSTGLPVYVRSNSFSVPLKVNYHVMVSKKNRIELAPTFGLRYRIKTYNIDPMHDQGITWLPQRNTILNYEYDADFFDNSLGLVFGLGAEFKVLKSSTLRIAYLNELFFTPFYKNEIHYNDEANGDFNGRVESMGSSRNIDIQFFVPFRKIFSQK